MSLGTISWAAPLALTYTVNQPAALHIHMCLSASFEITSHSVLSISELTLSGLPLLNRKKKYKLQSVENFHLKI